MDGVRKKERMEDVRFNLGPWWQEEGLVKG